MTYTGIGITKYRYITTLSQVQKFAFVLYYSLSLYHSILRCIHGFPQWEESFTLSGKETVVKKSVEKKKSVEICCRLKFRSAEILQK